MKVLFEKKGWGLMVVVAIFLVFPYPGVLKAGEIPSVEDVIKGKAICPTIEDLTGGKVKIGDLIDKHNMDLVREFISLGIQEAINQGMVLSMGTQMPPDQIVPEYFRQATEKNRGKAIIDENGTVYYEKMGIPWLGGYPFPEPKTGLEVMANVKYGVIVDDFQNNPQLMLFVDSKGKAYKTIGQDIRFVYCTTRTKIPPLGTIPGYKDFSWKRISVFTHPLELKGLGQYSIRYYDDAKNYDTGFAYLPAFKRTIRISSTTWQDNMGGSDLTFGDGQGLLDPYSGWSFKLKGNKYFLLGEPKSPFPVVDERGKINKRMRYTVGQKFPIFGRAIGPVHVVEAIPRGKHVYGKKILYIPAWPYWPASNPIKVVDIFDGQMMLWKVLTVMGGNYIESQSCATDWGLFMADLQTGHVTQLWLFQKVNQNSKPGDITFKKLLEIGR